ncbi:S9 family peptidase [Cesiribacter sp. SM1]|uniref:alpha/beta hydrolase family protein n=1 Tax=Cesiribacter sp. SM1 TaxID=2861196 RepID=UPI001CD3AAE6|nr:alpha/beta fold hydrolase [Cesiribacter sp. SM1]
MKGSAKYLSILMLALLCNTLSFATDTTHVAAQFKSGKLSLYGKLLLPVKNERVPVVILLVGSGANSSYRTNYKEWGQENLEDLLLPEGIAVFYFDKRGIGSSEGSWFKADFNDRTADAKAAIDFLKQHPAIDSSRIGVVGHSQGGWIAQLVASRYPYDVAFAVSLAGPTFGVRKQLLNDHMGNLMCKQYDPIEALQTAERKTNNILLFTSVFPLKENWKQLRRIRKFEPAADIRNIQVPFLFLFAENDKLVNPEWSEQALSEIFPDGIPPHIQHQTIPEADHSFRKLPFCYDDSLEDIPYSEVYQQAFKDWVVNAIQVGTQVAEE